MFTKTVLSTEAIDDLAATTAPSIYLRILRDDALILFREGDYRLLSQRLPTQVWGRLKDDLGRRRQAYRITLANDDVVSQLEPEVILGDGHSETPDSPYRCRLHDFLDAPIVERRVSIRDGRESVKGREEFWNLCLLPVLEALPVGHRLIEYFDSYAFQDCRAALRQKAPSGQTSATHSGLGWLIQALDQPEVSANGPVTLRIYTEVDPGKVFFSRDDISLVFQDLVDRLSLRTTEIEVYPLDLDRSSLSRDVRESLHSRSLIFNRRSRFIFNYGLKDANLNWDQGSRTFLDKMAANWAWKPELEPDWSSRYFTSLRSKLVTCDPLVIR
jgi:hypothetical protein